MTTARSGIPLPKSPVTRARSKFMTLHTRKVLRSAEYRVRLARCSRTLRYVCIHLGNDYFWPWTHVAADTPFAHLIARARYGSIKVLNTSGILRNCSGWYSNFRLRAGPLTALATASWLSSSVEENVKGSIVTRFRTVEYCRKANRKPKQTMEVSELKVRKRLLQHSSCAASYARA